MGRKRNPYIQLFTRDILSSPRCRALSESAAGIYLFLLCRLNEPPLPGAYRISDWELHPTWKRSKTQQCLATPDKYERLQYFAAMLSKNDLPWRQSSILAGLQELYKYGIIVVEGDMLIQPRMLKDSKQKLPDIDHDGDPVGTILDEPASGSMMPEGDEDFTENNVNFPSDIYGTEKGTVKVQRKAPDSHAPAMRALRVENMSNNINDKGNKGVRGNSAAKDNPEQSASRKTTSTTPKRRSVVDAPPTLDEVKAYFDERAQQGRPFLYVTPDGFFDACEQSGWRLKDGKPMMDWRARVRTFENYRRDQGEPPIGQSRRPPSAPSMKQGVQVTEVKPGQYDEEW